jgi:hypothetical protein
MNFQELIKRIDDCIEDGKRLAIVCELELGMLLTSYLDEYEMKSFYAINFANMIKSQVINQKTRITIIIIDCKDGNFEYFVELFVFKTPLTVDEVIAIGEYKVIETAHFRADTNTPFISIVQEMNLTNDDYRFLDEAINCDEYEDYMIDDDTDNCVSDDDMDSVFDDMDEDSDYMMDEDIDFNFSKLSYDDCSCDNCACERRKTEEDNKDSDRIAQYKKDSENIGNKYKLVMHWKDANDCRFMTFTEEMVEDALQNEKERKAQKSKIDRENKKCTLDTMIKDILKNEDMSVEEKDKLIGILFYYKQIEDIVDDVKNSKNNAELNYDLFNLLCEMGNEFVNTGYELGIKREKEYVMNCLMMDDGEFGCCDCELN